MDTRTALLAGASGLVGGQLLEVLLGDPLYPQVYSLGRRPLPRQHPRLVQQTVDFARLDTAPLPAADDAFCCLGTTLKKAGSQEAFRAVDYDAVLNFAQAARKAGVRRFAVVTAMGAHPRSRFFYNRVKGEVEEALQAQGFESLIIARPSLLLGERAEKRAGEKAATVVAHVLRPLLRPLASRPIEGRTVARALVALARQPPPGVQTVTSGALQQHGG
jgi:uncharacterized protein YbjT (DUF2867 family)